MKIHPHFRLGSIPAVIVALLGVLAPAVHGQGGGQATRARGATRTVPVARTHLQPAQTVLGALVGTWRFEIRFAGNFDGAPDVSGTRVVRALFDDLRLEWSEELDDSPMRGQGIIGFDARSDRFFSTAVYSAGAAPELLTGALDDAEPRIMFSPIALVADVDAGQQRLRSSELTILDRDHFVWAALDRGWRAVFTRRE